MVYDANLVLHGIGSGGVHNDLDETMVNAVELAVNATGNKVIDLRETGVKGLIASLVLTEEADSDAESDEATITIEESDRLDRNWQTVATFPVLHSHIRRIWVTTTVGFAAADIGAALTAEGGDTGILLAYDESINGVVGSGYIYVERDLLTDVFTDAVGQTMNGTTGRSTVTRVCVGTEPNMQMQPRTYNRRFITDKRYIRANVAAIADSLGICWILLTNDAERSPTPF